MLTGTYQHNLDAKGRVFIPARMREELGEHFFVTRWFDDCLVVFSEEKWREFYEKLNSQEITRSRDFQRFFFANACEAEADAQGRIILPQNLRESAGLTREVTIIGVMNRAEIWDKAKWENYNGSTGSDEIEQKMRELGI